jgi:hypothetical protein
MGLSVLTGVTVYEEVFSVNTSNVVVTGATFDTTMYRNGALFTGLTINSSLTDATRGAYTFSWSAGTAGSYQMYAKNQTTNVIFIADTVKVTTAATQVTVYVGE